MNTLVRTSEDLLNQYTEWLREKYTVNRLETSDEIITPFTNNLNDRIRLYIEYISEDTLRLSDDGNTLNELEMSGLDINTRTRQKILDNILSNFNVELTNDVLNVTTSYRDFPIKKHNMVQAILRVNDLLMTQKKNVINLFNEEVYRFFDDNSIYGTPGAHLVGQSGLSYHIDFTLPRTANRPETLIQFVNNPNFNNITTQKFIFDDINKRRSRTAPNSKLMIVANDLENRISSTAQAVAVSEQFTILKWSDKVELLQAVRQ